MKRFVFFLLLAITTTGFANCPFCDEDILERQSFYETDHLRVLVDFEPRVPGHLLIVPKRHVARADELLPEEWNELSVVIPKVVEIFRELLGTDQYILLEKNGPHAFQQIPHVHFHLLPVHGQHWKEIFGQVPSRLTAEELGSEVLRFRDCLRQLP
jgi:diadenosine tetraphosphate (Ap4A) HIT family hydrolase